MITLEHLSRKIPVVQVNNNALSYGMDEVAIEEPLEIWLEYGEEKERVEKNISVTMRTPGQDGDLAVGFLFTEGIIRDQQGIKAVSEKAFSCTSNKKNRIKVSLKQHVQPLLPATDRNFFMTSSCGVCGKGAIDAIRTVSSFPVVSRLMPVISFETLLSLPALLKAQQVTFHATGGLHACALFDNTGNLLLAKEDVGRHNALDKLIGAAVMQGSLPLSHTVLLLSGRASFELLQKAAMAGIEVVAAIGAPSSLAIETAASLGITLIGFLREQRFNIYTHQQRIINPVYENQN